MPSKEPTSKIVKSSVFTNISATEVTETAREEIKTVKNEAYASNLAEACEFVELSREELSIEIVKNKAYSSTSTIAMVGKCCEETDTTNKEDNSPQESIRRICVKPTSTKEYDSPAISVMGLPRQVSMPPTNSTMKIDITGEKG